MEHLSDDLEDHPNQHKNSHKLCNELVEFILKSTIRNFQGGGANVELILALKERNPKEQDCEDNSQGSE